MEKYGAERMVLYSFVWCAPPVATIVHCTLYIVNVPPTPPVAAQWSNVCHRRPVLTCRGRSGCGGDHFGGWWMWIWWPAARSTLLLVLPACTWHPQWLQIFHNRELINQSDGEPTRSWLSRMCCVTQRVTQVRNVDDCWSLQARGADPDLHGNGAHLHGAGNGGGYKQTLVEMVILAPAKCMHKTHIY